MDDSWKLLRVPTHVSNFMPWIISRKRDSGYIDEILDKK
jgi:hypothetical protein